MCDGVRVPVDSNLLMMEPLSDAFDSPFFTQLGKSWPKRGLMNNAVPEGDIFLLLLHSQIDVQPFHLYITYGFSVKVIVISIFIY
jgi:hypothetical protein